MQLCTARDRNMRAAASSVLVLALLSVTAVSTAASAGDWGPANITTVHVIQSNHLDVGFDGIDPTLGFAYNVINRYFDVYFPAAVATALELRNRSDTARLIWTTQSWLVSLYTNCSHPILYEEIHCPNASALAAFEDAIRRGDITWHAFPFNSELEVYDPSMLEFGLQLTHSLDAKYGLPPKGTLSQRDVPGTTRSIIPTLLSNGVTAISFGVNGGSMPPDVPAAWVWQFDDDRSPKFESVKKGAAPSTGGAATQRVLGFLHPGGYGGLDVSDAVIVPGCTHALIFAWRGDNAGPAASAEVLSNWAQLETEFPNAVIQSSTFDMFVAEVTPFIDSLPVITGEIGDTWIKGVASDPLKTTEFREMFRLRSDCLDAGLCSLDDPAFVDFSRLLLKVGEHTWGGDMKKFLKDWTNWTNTDFQAVLALNQTNYVTMIESWYEQRSYITNAIAALAQSTNPGAVDLANNIQSRLAQLVALQTAPSTDGFELSTNRTFDFGWFELGIDHKTGAINNLRTYASGRQWADDRHPIAGFTYQSLSGYDYDTYLETYLYCDVPPIEKLGCIIMHDEDFGKPFVQLRANPVSALWEPKLNAVWTNTAGTVLNLLVDVVLPADAVTTYGAPTHAWLNISADTSGDSPLSITLVLVDKTSTRLPEAGWLTFKPITAYADGADAADAAASGVWRLDKLNYAVDPSDVILNGSRNLHGVTSGIIYYDCAEAAAGEPAVGPVARPCTASNQFLVETLDAPLIAPGRIGTLLDASNKQPDLSHGMHVNLFNNLWGTNYIFWYPFTPEDAAVAYRFRVTFS